MLNILGYVLMISGYVVLEMSGNFTLALGLFGAALPIFTYTFWRLIKKWNSNRK